MKKFISRVEALITKIRNYTVIEDINYDEKCWYIGLTNEKDVKKLEKKEFSKFRYVKCWNSVNASEVKENLLLGPRFVNDSDKERNDYSIVYFYLGERE